MSAGVGTVATFGELKQAVADRRKSLSAPMPPPKTPGSIRNHFFPLPATSTASSTASFQSPDAESVRLPKDSNYVQVAMQKIATFFVSQGLAFNLLDNSTVFKDMLDWISFHKLPIAEINHNNIKSETEKMATIVVQGISKLLNEAETVNLAIDNASSGTMKVTVITARAPVVTPDLVQMRDFPLAFIMPTDYVTAFEDLPINGDFLADCLTQVAVKFNIFKKIIGATSDRGTDNKGVQKFLARVRRGDALGQSSFGVGHTLEFITPDIRGMETPQQHKTNPFVYLSAVQDSCGAHFLNTCLSGNEKKKTNKKKRK
jgi:hypothetical protein